MARRNILRNKISRRHLLAGGISAATILRWPAKAAEFTYKLGASSPTDHPVVSNAQKAADRIKQATNGQLEIVIYANNLLGNDSAMISQTISGAMQIYMLPLDLLSPRNPALGITGTGFAFPDDDHIFAAMDGDLGKMLRGMAEQIGIYCLDKCGTDGLRVITSRNKPIVTPDDLHGFKIRVPLAPVLVSLFRHLGASPATLNFAEVYSGLQTGVIDGQENPLILVDTAKLYEVQKYCSLTNHAWVGRYVGFNVAAWKKLPPNLQEIAQREFTAAAITERQEWATLTKDEQQKLSEMGLIFNTPDTKLFREVLAKTGFYLDIKKTVGNQPLGDQPWTMLEKYVGNLA